MNKTDDKDELLSRLFEAMGCDTLEEAVMQAELDTRESLKAAEAIKQCAGLPENVWPSPHERRFFIELKKHLSATLPSEAQIKDAYRAEYLALDGDGNLKHRTSEDVAIAVVRRLHAGTMPRSDLSEDQHLYVGEKK